MICLPLSLHLLLILNRVLWVMTVLDGLTLPIPTFLGGPLYLFNVAFPSLSHSVLSRARATNCSTELLDEFSIIELAIMSAYL